LKNIIKIKEAEAWLFGFLKKGGNKMKDIKKLIENFLASQASLKNEAKYFALRKKRGSGTIGYLIVSEPCTKEEAKNRLPQEYRSLIVDRFLGEKERALLEAYLEASSEAERISIREAVASVGKSLIEL